MQDAAKMHNSILYPYYGSITNARKDCYLKNIIITEAYPEVPLQSLLDHTILRILRHQEKIITVGKNSLNNLNLLVKWGCDGTSGISEYKQKFENYYLRFKHICFIYCSGTTDIR